LSECDKLTNEFKDRMNRILEILILIIVIALGAIVFFEIMTPIESSLLYGVGDFLRFGLFVMTLYLIMSFIINPLFKMLKVDK
jgi:hypothetical protein